MKRIRPIATVAAVGAMSLGAAGVGVTAAAAATAIKSATATDSGRCSRASLGDLVVHRDADGVLTVRATVEATPRANGAPWRVSTSDDGVGVATAAVRTVGDGSFTISRHLEAKDGSNHVVFVATNMRTGERCRLNAAV